MRRLTFLLRPGWLALAAVVAAFAFLCITVLAPWQLGKNNSTEHRNTLIADSVDAAPVPVESMLPATGPLATGDEWRQVTATGTYLPDHQVLVRLRTFDDAPAYEVLVPMRLASGPVILVNRGYVRPVQGTMPPVIEPAPSGEVTVVARARKSEGTVPGKDPIVENGYPQVYFLDAGQVGSAIGLPLVDGWFQLADGQPGVLNPIPLPQLDAGPYLSYGLQWLAFGIMAPLGLAYFVRAELVERRRERAVAAATAAAVADPEAGVTTPPTSDDAEVRTRRRFGRSTPDAAVAMTATQAKLADRYGQRR